MKLRASSAQRYALCPGSYKAADGLPDTTSADASRGAAVHAVLEDMLQSRIAAQHPGDIVDTAVTMFEKFMALVREHGGGYEVLMCERRMECGIWSGKPDAVVRMEDGTVWVVDWKSGWGDVDDADSNAQLRVYVMMVAQDLEASAAKDLYACIIQPMGKPTVVKFDHESYADIAIELGEIELAVAGQPDRRIPGPAQCKYCKAFGTDRCPESVTAVTVPLATDIATPMSLEAAQGIYALKAMADKLLKLAEERIREAVQNGEPCGYRYGKPRVTKKITDTAEAFVRLSLPEAALFQCASVSMPKLVDAYAKETGCRKKDAGAKVEELLGDIIETSESKPPLEAESA